MSRPAVALHPSREDLVAWLDGELPFLRRSRVDRHLRDCPQCREAVADLEATLVYARQALLEAGEDERIGIARARWKFREAAAAAESHQGRRRPALALYILAPAALVLLCWLSLAPRNNRPTAATPTTEPVLAAAQDAENAGYRSSTREDRFEVEIRSASNAAAESRDLRVWSAPAEHAYAARGKDSAGAVRFAVYATRGAEPVVWAAEPMAGSPRAALYELTATEDRDLHNLESAFWTWVRGQVWEPVSLAREVAKFATREGVELTVERRGKSAVWRAAQGRRVLSLEIGPDRLPRRMEILWYSPAGPNSIQIRRVARVEYPDFQTAAEFFRPPMPAAPPHRSAAAPKPGHPLPALPGEVELRAAEVQVSGAIHRLGLCVSGEVAVIRNRHNLDVRGIVASEDRRVQLLLSLDNLPGRSLLNVDVKSADQAIAIPPAAAPLNRPVASKVGPPGEKWLRERLGVHDAATHRELLAAMNRMVTGAVALSAHGWALLQLAERFPIEAEQSLPSEERRQLQAMVADHARSLETQIAAVQPVLDASRDLPSGDPSDGASWQTVVARLQPASERSARELLRLFATGEPDGMDASSSVTVVETAKDLRSVFQSAAFLRRDGGSARLR